MFCFPFLHKSVSFFSMNLRSGSFNLMAPIETPRLRRSVFWWWWWGGLVIVRTQLWYQYLIENTVK